MTRTGLLASLAMFGILGLSGAATADEGHCRPVKGTLTFHFVTEGCTSPYGLCTVGVISNGPLKGTTSYTVNTLTPTGGANANYTGLFIITTKHGTVSLQDSGTVDFSTGVYIETDVVTSGTGRFSGTTGNLSIVGSMAPGATSTIVGQICNGHSEDEDEDQSE